MDFHDQVVRTVFSRPCGEIQAGHVNASKLPADCKGKIVFAISVVVLWSFVGASADDGVTVVFMGAQALRRNGGCYCCPNTQSKPTPARLKTR